MKKKKTIIIIIVVLLLIGLGLFLIFGHKSNLEVKKELIVEAGDEAPTLKDFIIGDYGDKVTLKITRKDGSYSPYVRYFNHSGLMENLNMVIHLKK